MKPSTLPLYRCPRCQNPLEFVPDSVQFTPSGAVESAFIQCASCAARYSVAGGIIRLVPGREEIGQFQRREIDGWTARAQSGRAQQIDKSLWTSLPDVHGRVPDDGSAHWREAALAFPVALALLEPLAGKRVLEVGAAVGWAAYQFARRGAEAVATDICEFSLAEGRHFIDQGVHFDRLCADAERLPLADAAFDAVFCCAAIHHFEHPARLLREIARVLRPGGRFVAINESFRPLHRSARAMLHGPAVTQLHLEFGINEQVFTQRQYRRFFEQAGLRFACFHPRWDAAPSPSGLAVSKNIGLRQPEFAISDRAASPTRRLAHALGLERLLARSAPAAALFRAFLFHFTTSFRVMVGDKVD